MVRQTVFCPACGAAMEIRDRHGVQIDLCPHCRGVWLDKGELDLLLERSGRFLEVPGEHQQDPEGHRCGAVRFRDGFEWF